MVKAKPPLHKGVISLRQIQPSPLLVRMLRQRGQKSKKKGKCNYFKKIGHYINDCRKRLEKKKKKDASMAMDDASTPRKLQTMHMMIGHSLCSAIMIYLVMAYACQ